MADDAFRFMCRNSLQGVNINESECLLLGYTGKHMDSGLKTAGMTDCGVSSSFRQSLSLNPCF